MSNKVILVITEGKLKGQQFIFDSRSTSILGRATDCYPQFPSNAEYLDISRYHCLLDVNPPDISIKDLDSLNGTYVNGKLIGKRAENTKVIPEEIIANNFTEYPLKQGDTLQIGEVFLRVFIERGTDVQPEVEAEEGNQEENTLLSKINSLVQRANRGDNYLSALLGYNIAKKLGEGQYSEVYLATHIETGDCVAIKAIESQDDLDTNAINSFLLEVQNIKALNHLNIVQLKDYGYCERLFFFIMEYCGGGTLAEFLEERGDRLEVKEAMPIALQILDALEYAHNALVPSVKLADGTIGQGVGLVHWGIRPDNIFLSYSQSYPNGEPIAKLANYALDKAFEIAELKNLIKPKPSLHNPFFMPRQQIMKPKYPQKEIDIWATAAVLYYMLTNSYPRNFANRDPFLAILSILQEKSVPIRQKNALIPYALAELIDLALVDNPEIYFKNAIALMRALLSTIQ
jgi:serine/threonine protein kinase